MRLLLHRAASSKMLSSVDVAIETMDLAPVLDAFVDRLMLGEAVQDVIKEFIVSGNLGNAARANPRGYTRDNMHGSVAYVSFESPFLRIFISDNCME